MYTLQDYRDKKCDHDQYFAQFVTEGTINRVKQGIGMKAILASTDRHFNDIPLRKWDALVPRLPGSWKLKLAGDFYTLANGVCLAKAAAMVLKERHS